MWPAVEAVLHRVHDQPDAAAVAARFDRPVDYVQTELPAVAEHLTRAREDIVRLGAVLADPTQHTTVDGTGGVRDPVGASPITTLGQTVAGSPGGSRDQVASRVLSPRTSQAPGGRSVGDDSAGWS